MPGVFGGYLTVIQDIMDKNLADDQVKESWIRILAFFSGQWIRIRTHSSAHDSWNVCVDLESAWDSIS